MNISQSANNQARFSSLSEKYLHQVREVPDDGAFLPLDIPHLSEPIVLTPVKKTKWQPYEKQENKFAFKKGRGKLWMKYNKKIAEVVGKDAAIFLEEVRTWSNRNAMRKSQTMDDYLMEKAGIDLAEKFGWSEKTHYVIIKKLKDKGLLKVGKSYEKDKRNRKTERHYRINQYSPTIGYFEIAGKEVMTLLERKLFLGEDSPPTPPTEDPQENGKLDQFTESLCKTHRQAIEKQEDFTPTTNIYLKHSSLSTISKETDSEKKALDSNLTVEATEKVKECFSQKNERKINSFSNTQEVETKLKQQDRVVSTAKPVSIVPKKAGCTTSIQSQLLEKDFEDLHGFHPSRLREKHGEFLKVYPKKLDHDASYSRFAQTLFGGEIAFGELMKRVKRFVDSEEVKKRQHIEGGRFIKNASSWLRDQGWDAPALASSGSDAPDPRALREEVQAFVEKHPAQIGEFLGIVKEKLGVSRFASWFIRAFYILDGNSLRIEGMTKFQQKWILEKFDHEIDTAIRQAGLSGLEFVKATNPALQDYQESVTIN